MDAFVSRKRQRLSSRPEDTSSFETINNLTVLDDDESTDFKLALLASLHPDVSNESLLLDALLSSEGSVETASLALSQAISDPSPLLIRKPSSGIGHQTSLSRYATPTSPSAIKKPRLLSQKGKTLHLYSPEDVAAHTPCSIVHNFLEAEDANKLLTELVAESPTFERMTFKLFDNVVSSPHTACFYVESVEEQQRQKTEYIYNGDLLTDVRQLTPHMKKISAQVGDAVRAAIVDRIKTHYPNAQKLKYQAPPSTWSPNAAFVNCYDGGGESVGYHSDQLTYLGPRAVIGSISLGVSREFRVRRVVPQDDNVPTAESTSSGTSSKTKSRTKSKVDADMEGQIAIHLPHNSLLVMHAEMQEEWKHSIAPASAIDPHPLSGGKRINITYRDYRASLHPKFTPKCKCDVPTVLRVVQRKKENWGRYFWMCHAGNVPGKEGCTFFQWAEFDDDGEPLWRSTDPKIKLGLADQLEQPQGGFEYAPGI